KAPEAAPPPDSPAGDSPAGGPEGSGEQQKDEDNDEANDEMSRRAFIDEVRGDLKAATRSVRIDEIRERVRQNSWIGAAWTNQLLQESHAKNQSLAPPLPARTQQPQR